MLEAAEITRLAYLEALGMANYVSRRPLPAAAPSRKLAIAAIAGSVQPVIDDVPTGRRFEDLDVSEAKLTRVAAPVSKPGAAPSAVDSFSVAAIFAGGWLWLEELSGDRKSVV